MVINTNIAALTSARNLNQSSSLLNASLARLSSGSKITSPADDPAGLAEATLLNAQIGETTAANANVGNGMAFAQTQDGYLQQVGSALDEMAKLSVEAQDGTKTDSERADYQKEFSTLSAYVTDAVTKDFNGVSLFSGSAIGVTTDSKGSMFQMTGIAANYLSTTAVTTTTTSNVGYAANTRLGDISSAFNATTGGETVETDPLTISAPTFSTTITPNSTVSDLVNFLNSTGGNSAASYDSTTGQLTITANPGFYVDDIGSMFTQLGFSTGGIPGTDEFLDNHLGSTPISMTTTLTHPVTTTTTSSAGVLDISTTTGAAAALASVTTAISQLATDRATVGASIERLNFTSSELGTLNNNLSASQSQITDVDVAQESTNFAKYQILVQSGTSMLAQANSAPQSVLKLLS